MFTFDASNNLNIVGTVTGTISGAVTVTSGTLSATQGTSPWVISGAVTTSGTATVSGTVAFSNTTIAVTNAGTFAVQAVPGLPTTVATVRTNGNTSSSGWTSIVGAGGGSTTVRLMRLIVSASAATNIEIGDGSTVFLGPYYLTADGSIVLDISGEPWCVTGANGSLQINNSNAVAITYTTWTTQS